MVILKLNQDSYQIFPSPREAEAIDWMEANFPGKLAAFIAKYLEERHVNMKFQENEEIIKSMSSEERVERINASKLESTTINK